MTQTEKAERFEGLTREGDIIQRDISKLQSANAGVNTKSEDYDNKLNHLRGKLSFLEQEMAKLFI
tara:strand:- start:3701 stop:3895 length:195 start_codon:yes stop_codon:yes gene_type:complete